MRDTAPLPRLALWLGLAGLLPFVATALGAGLGIGGDAAFAALAAYGATILSFLGAVHWGFALRGPIPGDATGDVAPGPAAPEASAAAARLGFGVLPALLAWVALLLPLPDSLLVLAGGILLTAAIESLAAARGLVPLPYLRLRWALSLGAALCLVAGAIAA